MWSTFTFACSVVQRWTQIALFSGVKMTYPTVLTLIFASFLCCIAAHKGLHLKGYSEGGVEGCYEHSQDLAVCFDVKKDSMLIKKASGEGIVHYQELGSDMFLYQVLDDAFVG